jgi:hypothetical protein
LAFLFGQRGGVDGVSAMIVLAVTGAKLAVVMGALESHGLWSICLYSNPASSKSLHAVTVDQNPGKIWADRLGLKRYHSVVLQKSRYPQN